jgi:catechol 2,3-dioxygenase-like lactoylglutathione lyase family enzyme
MTMQPGRPLPRPPLTAAEPQLFVADIVASCGFFTQKLGFSVVFLYGEPPFYGQVMRDGARLNLRCVEAPVFDNARRERESLLSATLTVDTVDDIDRLFAEYASAGVPFHQMLETQTWGAKDFVVRDPDGNLVHFAGPVE